MSIVKYIIAKKIKVRLQVAPNKDGIHLFEELISEKPLHMVRRNKQQKQAFREYVIEKLAPKHNINIDGGRHKNIIREKLIINFDCVGVGDTIAFCVRKNKLKEIDNFINTHYRNRGSKKVLVTDKYSPNSDHRNFTNAVGVVAFSHGLKNDLYFKNIHTKKDNYLDKSNIDFLVESNLELSKNIQ